MQHWYVKRADTITGPFPQAMLERNIVLGRVVAGDLLSRDSLKWELAGKTPVFESIVARVEVTAVFAQADERHAERRQGGPGNKAHGRKSGRDRRRPEPAEIVRRRVHSHEVWQSLKHSRPDHNVFWCVLVIVVALTLGLSIIVTPVPSARGDCSSDPQPGVNWKFCYRPKADLRQADLRSAIANNAQFASSDLAGANLADADLSYADLSRANFRLADLVRSRLVGANLRDANFAHASLRAANLQFADLRGANFDNVDLSGALLGKAIWLNGEHCDRGSVGVCRRGSSIIAPISDIK